MTWRPRSPNSSIPAALLPWTSCDGGHTAAHGHDGRGGGAVMGVTESKPTEFPEFEQIGIQRKYAIPAVTVIDQVDAMTWRSSVRSLHVRQTVPEMVVVVPGATVISNGNQEGSVIEGSTRFVPCRTHQYVAPHGQPPENFRRTSNVVLADRNGQVRAAPVAVPAIAFPAHLAVNRPSAAATGSLVITGAAQATPPATAAFRNRARRSSPGCAGASNGVGEGGFRSVKSSTSGAVGCSTLDGQVAPQTVGPATASVFDAR